VYLIEDQLPLPHFSALPTKLFCVGDFLSINKKYGDVHSIIRYVIYAYILSALERFRSILSCHGSAVYSKERNTVLLFMGTAGAGKTCLLLSAIERGWKIVGNDLVSVAINPEYVTFYAGPATCPVKSHTLKPHLQFLCDSGVGFDQGKVNRGDWLAADSINLERFAISQETIQDPKVVLVLPRIESSAMNSSLVRLDSYTKMREEIYEYATEKIRTESLMNYRFPVPSFDDQETMFARIARVEMFIKFLSGVYFGFGKSEGVFEEIERTLK
jgi:hypothetical protein